MQSISFASGGDPVSWGTGKTGVEDKRLRAKKILARDWARWHTPLIPVSRRQVILEFQASQGHTKKSCLEKPNRGREK